MPKVADQKTLVCMDCGKRKRVSQFRVYLNGGIPYYTPRCVPCDREKVNAWGRNRYQNNYAVRVMRQRAGRKASA